MDSAAFWMTGFRTAASAGLGNRQRCGPHTGQHSGGQHEKRHPGECLFISVCYCFSPWGGGRHFGGDFVGKIRDPPLPHPRATPRSGGVSPTGPGPPPWGAPEWVGFPAAASTGHGRSCFEATYSRTPGASPPAPAGPSAPPP